MAIITLAGGLIGLLFGFFAHRLRCCRRLAVIEFGRGSHEGKLTVWGHTGGLLFGAARRGVGAGGPGLGRRAARSIWNGRGSLLDGRVDRKPAIQGRRVCAQPGCRVLRRAPVNSRRYFPPGIVCRSSSVSALDSTRCSPSKTTSNTFLS